ncbi:MAG: L,D-transpeptidase family protein [Victivallales bacterium]|nr:L,D-transpeptidase family protein [Victivallales bacterium]
MYWYIKYPLIAILVLCLLGLGSLVFRGCRKATPTETPEPSVVVENVPAAPGTQVSPSLPDNNSRTVVPPVAKVNPELEEMLANAEAQFERGALEAARFGARGVIGKVVEFDNYWKRAVEIINKVDGKIMNSTAPASEKQRYIVQPGNSLERIARSKHTAVGALMRMNEIAWPEDGRDPIVRPNQTIFYIEGKWSIRVSKQQYLLILYFNDEIYRVYTVGIGRDNRTPTGTFLITEKQTEPAWCPPGKSIPFGDPENVLGTRWMKLTPTEGTDPTLEGYGIHGTWEPESCGTSCSLGCVRMRNEEVEELFDFIPAPGGTTPPVRVVIEE